MYCLFPESFDLFVLRDAVFLNLYRISAPTIRRRKSTNRLHSSDKISSVLLIGHLETEEKIETMLDYTIFYNATRGKY